MSSKVNPLLFGAIKLLGAQIVDIEPFFGEIACMRNVEREEYAHLEIIKILFPDAEELHAVVGLLQRITQIKGMALFPRTEVTDLSAKAQMSPYRKKKDIGAVPQDLSSVFEEAMSSDAENRLYTSSDEEEAP